MAFLYNRTLLGIERERTTDIHNTDVFPRHAEQKQPDADGQLACDSVYAHLHRLGVWGGAHGQGAQSFLFRGC